MFLRGSCLEFEEDRRPARRQLISYSIVVIVAIAAMTALVAGFDALFSRRPPPRSETPSCRVASGALLYWAIRSRAWFRARGTSTCRSRPSIPSAYRRIIVNDELTTPQEDELTDALDVAGALQQDGARVWRPPP